MNHPLKPTDELLRQIDSTLLWSETVGLPEKGNPVKQAGKVVEEAQELLEAVQILREAAQADQYEAALEHVMTELGDLLVTGIVEGQLLGLDLAQCLHKANAKNWKRVDTGAMVDGSFVKQEDLVQ